MKKSYWEFLLPLGLAAFMIGAFLAPGSDGELAGTHRLLLAIFLLVGFGLIVAAFYNLGIFNASHRSGQS